jgi:8-oxo-dGTP diphosphatase
MQKYTLGFIFNKNLDHVLLMHKNRPDWQAGKVNGLGGKFEEGEDGISCIKREVKEESNLDIEKDKWIYAGVLYSQSFNMEVFCSMYEGDMEDAKTLEDEEIEWFPIEHLPSNTIDNIPWLIHITLDKLKNKKIETFEVKYFNSHRK